MDEVNAEWVTNYLGEKGFENTPKWIMFALKSKVPNFPRDFDRIMDSMRAEIRNYKREYYDYPKLKETCFDSILGLITGAMSVGTSEFNRITAELIPTVQEMIETNKILGDIAGIAGSLEDKPRFYMLCFYYLILWEGSTKNVCRQLLAMKRLKEGKNVRIAETLAVMSEDRTEIDKNLEDVLPDYVRKGIHKNLRNAIAHTHFRYLQEKKEMEFWDVCQKGVYSLKPARLSYQKFSKYLLDVNMFCEIFGFLLLLLIALSDIANRQ